MHAKFYLFLFLLHTIFISSTSAGIFSKGTVGYDLERINRCEEHKSDLNALNIQVDRCNRTHRCIKGNILISEALIKDSMELMASKWTDGGWKPNAFYIRINDVCRTLDKIIGSTWREIRMSMNIKKCPPAPGNYTIPSFYLDPNVKAIGGLYFMYGKYKIRFIMRNDDKMMFCRDFIINVKDL